MTPSDGEPHRRAIRRPASTPTSQAREEAAEQGHPLTEQERRELERDLQELRKRQFVI